ncbi:MAG: hypothetical protein ABI615_07285 [Chthoniobacterales bacterium]
MKKTVYILAAVLAFTLASCDNPQRTIDQTRADIQAFRASPGAQTQAKVEQSFTKLNAELAKLEKKQSTAEGDARTKLDADLAKFNSQRTDLLIDFQSAKVGKVIDDVKGAFKDIGNAVKNFGKGVQSSATNSTGN